MIFGKLWRAFTAQVNKIANVFYTSDPVAQMQYEYDKAVDQLKDGRVGLEQYRALVERVTRQVDNNKSHIASLDAKIKAYLRTGDRDTAAKFAVELQKAQKELGENEQQLHMHEQAYNNNLTKVKHASGKLAQLRDKIQKYDADLKMSRAEAELAKLAQNFNFDVTTDFGEMEQVVQDKISLNRAKARVAADLSGEGIAQIEAEQAVERAGAEDVLQQYEQQMGLGAPPTRALSPPAEHAPAPGQAAHVYGHTDG
jgi:phage shock protein A